MKQNCLNWFVDQSSTEIFNRDGLLSLYFNIALPESFAPEKIPQAGIIVSRTWKLRFTSNSISRSGTRLVITLASTKSLSFIAVAHVVSLLWQLSFHWLITRKVKVSHCRYFDRTFFYKCLMNSPPSSIKKLYTFLILICCHSNWKSKMLN